LLFLINAACLAEIPILLFVIRHTTVSVVELLAWSPRVRGFEPRVCRITNNKIGISAKHAALMRKSKDLLAQNQDNVYDVRQVMAKAHMAWRAKKVYTKCI
jgi:hypothetical protein